MDLAGDAATPDQLLLDRAADALHADLGGRYLVAGLERCPTTGRRHLQCYAYWDNATTWDRVHARLAGHDYAWHLERAGGTPEQNRSYCCKDGTWTERGTAPQQGARSDLASVRDSIAGDGGRVDELKLADAHFAQWCQYRTAFREYAAAVRGRRTDRTRLIWCWGNTGTGKSSWVAASAGSSAFFLSDHSGRWWDGYAGQLDVVIDDLSDGELPVSMLLRLADRLPLRVQLKGSSAEFTSVRLWITSNASPADIYSGATEEQIRAIYRRIDQLWRFQSFVDYELASPANEFKLGGRPRLEEVIQNDRL